MPSMTPMALTAVNRAQALFQKDLNEIKEEGYMMKVWYVCFAASFYFIMFFPLDRFSF